MLYLKTQLLDEIDLLDGASAEYDLDRIRAGELTPVFFGSALTNFGIGQFIGQVAIPSSFSISSRSSKVSLARRYHTRLLWYQAGI